MSWSIPAQIEQDFISGKAQYRTFQTGVGGQSILPVPSNAYAVIFGYDFSPAGGGIQVSQLVASGDDAARAVTQSNLTYFETQQISFYTGTDFYPFIHHVDVKQSTAVRGDLPNTIVLTTMIDNTSISRQVYITSDKDITITHGCVISSPIASTNAIPQTNRTPALLTYGGSPQVLATQTDFGPAASPVQFMQPSPKDYQDFAFGILPNGASGQAFATPDAARGLAESSFIINVVGAQGFANAYYFLNLHYALYTQSVPESRG